MKPRECFQISIASRSRSAMGTDVPALFPKVPPELQYDINEGFSLAEEDPPCSSVDVTHHGMESSFAVCKYVLKCTNMALVHIHVRIGGKFECLLLARTPLVERGIQLIYIYQVGAVNNNNPRLTPVETRASMGIGTSRRDTPSRPR